MYRNRRRLELLLVIVAAWQVMRMWMFHATLAEDLFRIRSIGLRVFLTTAVAVWLPRLARATWRRIGDVTRDADELLVRTRFGSRRIALARGEGEESNLSPSLEIGIRG
jgi:hypothetical protein